MLANHYLKTENLDSCAQLCNHMQRSVSDPSEEVLVTMANLHFRKGEIDEGIAQFKKLFEQRRGNLLKLVELLKDQDLDLIDLKHSISKSDHYEALCTLIKFLHRAGRIDESQVFFDKIEKELPKAVNEPGYNYAKGLFYQ